MRSPSPMIFSPFLSWIVTGFTASTASWRRRRLRSASLDLNPNGLGFDVRNLRARLAPQALAEAEALAASHRAGTFSYLNRSHSLGRPVDWAAESASAQGQVC